MYQIYFVDLHTQYLSKPETNIHITMKKLVKPAKYVLLLYSHLPPLTVKVY